MSEFLTPSGLAQRLVEKTGINIDIAKNFSTIFFTIVRKGLKNSESFSVYNFGTFKKTWIEATVGLNPSNGEKIQIPAHWRIKFVPCTAVARRINQPYAHLKPQVLPEDEPTVVEEEEPFYSMPVTVPVIQPEIVEDENDDLLDKTVIVKTSHKGLLKRAIELIDSLDEEKDEDEEICEVKKKPKIFVVAGCAIVFLILIVSLLIKSCSGKTKKTGIKPETQKTELPLKKEQEEFAAVEQKNIEVQNELEIEQAAILFESYTVPTGSDYHTIAADKYGNRHLWPVLYAANKDKRPDPDLIGAYYKIQIPQLLKGEAGKKQIESSVMEAYNGYLLMCEKQPESSKNAERKRLAVRVLVSGEILNPGFIYNYRKRILPEYAEMAMSIVNHQYINIK